MKRTNIGGMDIYESLRRQAKQNRDRTIAAAHQRYRQAIQNINGLHKLLGRSFTGGYAKDIVRSPEGTPFGKLTALEAAERVLVECGPMKIDQLTLEVQRRGCRRNDDPRKVHGAIKSAFHYHKDRFVRDEALRWAVI